MEVANKNNKEYEKEHTRDDGNMNMKNNNYKISLVLVIIVLIVILFSATYAYFSLAISGTTDTTAVEISTEAIGKIALTNPTNAMHITLSAFDMAVEQKGATYYATKTAAAHVASAENNVVASAKITGGAETTNYECTGTVNVKTTMTGGKNPTASELNGNVVLTGGSKTTLGTSGNTSTVTLTDSAAAAGVDVAFKMSKLTNAATEDITANASFTNSNTTQDSLNGATITTTISLKDFACKVVGNSGTSKTAVDELIELADASEVAYDGTVDNNLRYIGANPNNYIYFNCSDYSNPTADTCEKWRIIGAFNNIKTSSGETKTLLKIIRSESLGSYSWDYKRKEVGSSRDYDSNDWEDSQLMLMLNGVSLGNYKSGYTLSGDYLLDKNNIRIMNISGSYYEGSRVTYIPAYTSTSGYSSTETVDFSNTGLKNDTTRGIIETVVWNLGGVSGFNKLASHFYSYERGKDVYSGRPTEWTGKIGLMYPSDYGYATSGESTTDRETCLATGLDSWDSSNVSDCKNNDWLFINGSSQWTITSFNDSTIYVYNISRSGKMLVASTNAFVVRPTVYLTSKIGISGGEGSETNPYTLKVA